MNKLKLGVPILLLGALILVGAGCGGRYSSPEKTLETMVEAQTQGDVDGYLNCLTSESREWFENITKVTPEGSLTPESLQKQEMDYDPLKLRVIEETGDTAVMAEEGQTVGLIFKKEKGDWKVDLIATMQQMFKGLEEIGQ